MRLPPWLSHSELAIGILVPSLYFSHMSSRDNNVCSRILGDCLKGGGEHAPELSGSFVKRVECYFALGGDV